MGQQFRTSSHQEPGMKLAAGFVSSNAPENGFSSVAESLKAMGSPNEAFCGTFLRDWFLALAFSCGGADAYSEEEIALILEYAKELPTERGYIDIKQKI